jgi:hypothetical protein
LVVCVGSLTGYQEHGELGGYVVKARFLAKLVAHVLKLPSSIGCLPLEFPLPKYV